MKKRIGSFFLAIVMLFTLVVSAFAQSITLGVDKDTVKAGEDVTVTVNFNEDLEKVSGLALNLHFNSNLFIYKEGQEFDDYAVIVKGEEGTAPDQYKVINWASLKGVGTIKAGKYVTCTFTAKEDIADLTTAEFVAKVDMRNTTMAPGYDDPTYPDSKISVTVTPASTEPEGYAVAASTVNPPITVNENAQVALKISNKDVTTYNAYYMEVSYDTNILTYKSINTDAAVTDNNGTLKIAGYGADKTCGTDNIVLTFTGKTTGEAKVTVTSAKVDVKANAAEKDAPDATITTKTATITVGGYQVTLPDAFTGKGTANPGQDYTFTAKDLSKKYDFTGSTMGGETVEVIDNGGGTYTVKNVSGELVINATEKVAINLSGDAVNTIVNKSWGEATEVDAGKELSFTAQLEPGKELVVTVNGKVVAGSNRPGFMFYNIAADQVTGTELNIVVNYKAADQATIIESGTAWNKVGNLSRKGWTQSGDKVDAGATLDFFFKPETGKTINDYVIRANGADCMYTKVGSRYKVTIPAEIITAGATVTINFDYAATPEPTITVDVSEYLRLDNQSIFLITAACDKLTTGKVLAYDGNQMYWSAKYNKSNGAYAWLVISNKSLEEVKAEAKAAITAVDGAKVEIAYTGDVNLTNAADINDAQLVWNMYNAEYSDFQKVNVRKFLEADMTADGKLDTADAAAIIARITK
ncbi:MAG: hypothetical protein EGQ48_02390 [Clostridiales bacterium]|nr:hypothetical protein [Clostridiales bacterium]